MMLYTNYESSGSCSFRQEDFCEVWSKFNEWFQRRSCLNEKVYARTHSRTDGQRKRDCHNSSLCALCAQVSYKIKLSVIHSTFILCLQFILYKLALAIFRWCWWDYIVQQQVMLPKNKVWQRSYNLMPFCVLLWGRGWISHGNFEDISNVRQRFRNAAECDIIQP